jgi:TPR repeat protein
MHEPNGQPSERSKWILWGVFISIFILSAIGALALLDATGSRPAAKPAVSEIEVLKREAEAGDAESMHLLAVYFEEGNKVPRSYQEALRYYQLSSDAGNLQARFGYAKLLRSESVGVLRDVKKAYQLLADLAERGNESAQLTVALYYRYKRDGTDEPADLVESYAWANVVLANMKGRPEYHEVQGVGFAWKFSDIRQFRDALELELSKAQLSQAQQRSLELFKKAEAQVAAGAKKK